MIRIFIVDDQSIVRRGLMQIIGEAPDLTVAGEAANGRDALEQADESVCDVVILDISLPDMNGLSVLKQLKKESPGLAVLVLSVHPEEQYAVRVLNGGGAGYLTKDVDPEELIIAIRRIANGKRYVCQSLAEKLYFDLEQSIEQAPHQKLSNREYQVLCKIASGQTVSEIAKEMFISVKTVSTYRTRILQKMSMENNAQLTSYAVKAKLVL